MSKKYLGLILAAAVLIITAIIPPAYDLTMAGKNTLGLLLSGLILWVFNVIPISATAILLIVLQPVYGITSLGEAIRNFASPVVFFVLASYGLSLAITSTPLAHRMLRKLFSFSGNDSNKILLVFMITTCFLSSFMSNVPVASLMMGLGLGILTRMSSEKKDLNFGKVLMIAIPFAGMIGGIMTPAGSSINILALSLLESYTEIRVTFLEWMLYGSPIAILILPISWFVLIKMFKPENIDQRIISDFMDTNANDKLSTKEIKVLVIVTVIIILWIASTWIAAFDLTLIALLGLIAFFLPGIEVLSWKEYQTGASWDAVVMIGGVISIGTAVVTTGVGEWMLEALMGSLTQLNLFWLLFVLGIALAILHLPLPIAPAMVTVFAAPLTGLAIMMGIHPALLIVPLAFYSGACLIVPLDAVPLITYTQGYYTMGDMFVSGAITTVIWVLIASVWIPIAGRMLGVF
jgi:sodium-dependent dicarboxylate transporter 2/3/5